MCECQSMITPISPHRDLTRRVPVHRSSQGYKIVFADALQDEKHRRRVAAIGNEVRALGRHRIGLSRRQPHFFLWILQENSNRSRDDIERVVHVSVIMPRHLLRGADLKLGDAKSRPHRVIGTALNLVQPARIGHSLRLPTHHSIFLMSASRMTFAQRAVSDLIWAWNSSGELMVTAKPMAARRSFACGRARILAISR